MREMTRTAHTRVGVSRERSYSVQECRSRLGPARCHAGWSQCAGRGGVASACGCSLVLVLFGRRFERTRSLRTRSLRPCQEASDHARPCTICTCIPCRPRPHRSFQEAAAPAAGTRQRREPRTSSTSSFLQQPLKLCRRRGSCVWRPRVDYSQDTSSGPSSEADPGADRLQGAALWDVRAGAAQPVGPDAGREHPGGHPGARKPRREKLTAVASLFVVFSEASCSRQPGRRHGGFGRLGRCARRLRRCAGWPRCHGWSWWHGWPRWPGRLWGFGWLGWHGRPGWHGHGWPGRVRGSWWHDQPSSTDSWRDRSGNGRRDGAGSGHCRSSREHDAADDARPNLYVFYECQIPFP